MQILPKGSVTLGTSQKGGTLYMEPKTAIQMNNSSTQLEAAEKKEEEKCLFELCGFITVALDDIDVAVSAAVDLDLANARARYSECAVSPMGTRARVHSARAATFLRRLQKRRNPYACNPSRSRPRARSKWDQSRQLLHIDVVRDS